GPAHIGGGELMVLEVGGFVQGGAEGSLSPLTQALTLSVPAVLETGADGRVAIAVHFRQNKVTLGGGSRLIVRQVAAIGDEGSYECIGELAGGTALVNFS